MKRVISLAMGIALIAPLLLFSAAQAHDGSGSDDKTVAQTTTSNEAETEQENEQEIKDTANNLTELKARLEKRKTELKLKISAAELLKIKNKCTSSQGNISSLRGRIKGIETSRSKVYANLVERLTKFSTSLKSQGVDTTDLETQITELSAKIQTFNTDLASYKQAVTDLAAMDCKSDPTAFKTSLEAARTLQTTVKNDAAAIKTYVNDTIKATLKDIRAQLEKSDNSQSEGTN